MNGCCSCLVECQTSSRTMSNSFRTSTCGSLTSRATAIANGLSAPLPSSAVSPCLAAYTTMNPALGSMFDSPLSTSFKAMVRCIRGRERIVAAGIEHHEVKLARGAGGGDHLLQRHRLGLGVLVHGEPGVERHQIIDAADFKTMAGVIHHRPVGFLGIVRKGAQRVEKSIAGE